jgi:hypothetical protein
VQEVRPVTAASSAIAVLLSVALLMNGKPWRDEFLAIQAEFESQQPQTIQ